MPASHEDGWFRADHQFPIDHPSGHGHFPGNPIIPGALLLDHALHFAGRMQTADSLPQIQVVKFLRPVRPGDRVQFRWRPIAGGVSIECRMAEEDHLLMSASVKYGTAP